jgi:hypothetical protein
VYGYDFLNYDCVRIFFTGEQVCPDFDLADYAIGFEKLVFSDRYIRFPLYALNYSPEMLRNIEIHFNDLNFDDFKKRKFAVFTYSNPNPKTPRDLFFLNLNSAKNVISAGRHLNNNDLKLINKVDFEREFKFSIAFENVSYEGVVSEKLIDSFAATTIPVYFGATDVYDDFYSGSFINLHEYTSFTDAIEFILSLEYNTDLLFEMLKKPKFKDHVFSYENKLLDFLANIFKQGKEDAKRRPISQRVDKKIKELRVLSYYYRLINFKIIKLLRLFVKGLNK